MTTFSHIFRSTRDLAISQGRRPVVCLLGPDFVEEYRSYVEWGAVNGYYRPIDVMEFDQVLPPCNGLIVFRMRHNGVAMRTTPAPESGFDLV